MRRTPNRFAQVVTGILVALFILPAGALD